MAKDAPFWVDYEKFPFNNIPTLTIKSELSERFISLSPAARMQLFYGIENGGGCLSTMTNYPLRSLGLGINMSITSKEIIDSGLMIPSFSSEVIESSFSKQELLDYGGTYGVICRKPWNRSRIVEAINETDESLLEKMAIDKNLVGPNFQFFPGLKDAKTITDEHLHCFKLMCFV